MSEFHRQEIWKDRGKEGKKEERDKSEELEITNHTSPLFLGTVMKLPGLQPQFQSLDFQPKIYGKKNFYEESGHFLLGCKAAANLQIQCSYSGQ